MGHQQMDTRRCSDLVQALWLTFKIRINLLNTNTVLVDIPQLLTFLSKKIFPSRSSAGPYLPVWRSEWLQDRLTAFYVKTISIFVSGEERESRDVSTFTPIHWSDCKYSYFWQHSTCKKSLCWKLWVRSFDKSTETENINGKSGDWHGWKEFIVKERKSHKIKNKTWIRDHKISFKSQECWIRKF